MPDLHGCKNIYPTGEPMHRTLITAALVAVFSLNTIAQNAKEHHDLPHRLRQLL